MLILLTEYTKITKTDL